MTDRDSAYVLHVELRVRPDRREQFLAAIEENATASVRDEPGCSRFDVVQDVADPDHFYLYEIYRDEDALGEHRRAPHFLRLRQAAAECVVPGGQHKTSGLLLFSPPNALTDGPADGPSDGPA